MTLYLLDTNVISEARKKPHRRDPRFDRWMRSVPALDTYLSVITIGEVAAGVMSKERKDREAGRRLRTWFEDELLRGYDGRILPVTLEVAEHEARLQVPDPRPKSDAVIAATALAHGMTVATRNVTDFTSTGAPLVNPWEPSG